MQAHKPSILLPHPTEQAVIRHSHVFQVQIVSDNRTPEMLISETRPVLPPSISWNALAFDKYQRGFQKSDCFGKRIIREFEILHRDNVACPPAHHLRPQSFPCTKESRFGGSYRDTNEASDLC